MDGAKAQYATSVENRDKIKSGQFAVSQLDIESFAVPAELRLRTQAQIQAAKTTEIRDPYDRARTEAQNTYDLAMGQSGIDRNKLQAAEYVAVRNSAQAMTLEHKFQVQRDQGGNITAMTGGMDEYNAALGKIAESTPELHEAILSLSNFDANLPLAKKAAIATREASTSRTDLEESLKARSTFYQAAAIREQMNGKVRESLIDSLNAEFVPVFKNGKLISLQAQDVTGATGGAMKDKYIASLNNIDFETGQSATMSGYRAAAIEAKTSGFRLEASQDAINEKYYPVYDKNNKLVKIQGIDQSNPNFAATAQAFSGEQTAAQVDYQRQNNTMAGNTSSLFYQLGGNQHAATQAEIAAKGSADRAGMSMFSGDYWHSWLNQKLEAKLSDKDYKMSSDVLQTGLNTRVDMTRARASGEDMKSSALQTVGGLFGEISAQPDQGLRQKMIKSDIGYLGAMGDVFGRPSGYATEWDSMYQAKGGPMGQDNDLADTMKVLGDAILSLVAAQSNGGVVPLGPSAQTP